MASPWRSWPWVSIGPLAFHISGHELMALDLAVTYAVASVVMHLIAQWVIGELEVE